MTRGSCVIPRTINLFDGSHCLDIPLPVDDANTYLPNCIFSGVLRLTIELLNPVLAHKWRAPIIALRCHPNFSWIDGS